MLNANAARSEWITAERLVEMFTAIPDRPAVIDLSGGQPDLVPEWVPWMMEALDKRGISNDIYLWSDDNLSNDYFWKYLTKQDRSRISAYRNYGKVGCFKGFDESSFSFNTRARRDLFDGKFKLFRRLLAEGIDMYAYATFTTNDGGAIPRRVAEFVDRLQGVHENLPLRLVPLEVKPFTPSVTEKRIGDDHILSMTLQQEAIAAWNSEIEARFSEDQRAKKINEVEI